MGVIDFALMALVLSFACWLFYKSFIKKGGSCGSCPMKNGCKKSCSLLK